MEGVIYLEDGTIYHGLGFGYKGTAVGELVFNTTMMGYQEVLTDPSYSGQIINMTYPLIGNYGINEEDNESDRIHAKGLIVKSICHNPSNFKCSKTIEQWLTEMKIPGVYHVDTRSITRRVRIQGSMKCVLSNEGLDIEELKKIGNMEALRWDYMKEAGTKEKIHIDGIGPTVAVLDLGARRSLIENLKKRDCNIILFPYGSTAEEIKACNPNGFVITNGPGNPKEAKEAMDEVGKLIKTGLPTLGIGMGHQIIALAMGGDTFKLPYGHRGGNHGIYDKNKDCSYIISQNHGYAVRPESVILKGMDITHINLNDETVEGMKHNKLPISSVQFLPETAPGSQHTAYLFDDFLRLMTERK